MKKQKYFLLIVILYTNIFLIGTFPMVAGQTWEDLTEEELELGVSNLFLQVVPNSITTQTGESGTSTVTMPCGGDIATSYSNLAIIEDLTQYETDFTGPTNQNGTKCLKSATYAFEFDVGVYTQYKFEHIHSGDPVIKYDNNIITGRFYDGQDLDFQEEWGSKDELDVCPPGTPFWKKTYPSYGTNEQFRRDGDAGFQTLIYKEWPTSIPYRTFTDIDHNSEYPSQRYTEVYNALNAYAASDAFDPGFVDISFDITLNPGDLANTIEKSYETDDELASLALDENVYYKVAGFEILTSTGEAGLLKNAGDAYVSFADADETALADPDFPSEISGQPSDAGFENHLVFRFDPVEVKTGIVGDSVVSSGVTDFANSGNLYSKDLEKNYTDFTEEEQTMLNDLLHWRIDIGGFKVLPAVDLYKQEALLRYYELFLDRDALNADDIYSKQEGETSRKFTALGGWKIQNAYAHLRCRMYVKIIAPYTLTVIQPEGQEGLSNYVMRQESNTNKTFAKTDTELQTAGLTIVDRGLNFPGLGNLFDGWQWNSDWLSIILLVGGIILVIGVVAFLIKRRAATTMIDTVMPRDNQGQSQMNRPNFLSP